MTELWKWYRKSLLISVNAAISVTKRGPLIMPGTPNDPTKLITEGVVDNGEWLLMLSPKCPVMETWAKTYVFGAGIPGLRDVIEVANAVCDDQGTDFIASVILLRGPSLRRIRGVSLHTFAKIRDLILVHWLLNLPLKN